MKHALPLGLVLALSLGNPAGETVSFAQSGGAKSSRASEPSKLPWYSAPLEYSPFSSRDSSPEKGASKLTGSVKKLTGTMTKSATPVKSGKKSVPPATSIPSSVGPSQRPALRQTAGPNNNVQQYQDSEEYSEESGDEGQGETSEIQQQLDEMYRERGYEAPRMNFNELPIQNEDDGRSAAANQQQLSGSGNSVPNFRQQTQPAEKPSLVRKVFGRWMKPEEPEPQPQVQRNMNPQWMNNNQQQQQGNGGQGNRQFNQNSNNNGYNNNQQYSQQNNQQGGMPQGQNGYPQQNQQQMNNGGQSNQGQQGDGLNYNQLRQSQNSRRQGNQQDGNNQGNYGNQPGNNFQQNNNFQGNQGQDYQGQGQGQGYQGGGNPGQGSGEQGYQNQGNGQYQQNNGQNFQNGQNIQNGQNSQGVQSNQGGEQEQFVDESQNSLPRLGDELIEAEGDDSHTEPTRHTTRTKKKGKSSPFDNLELHTPEDRPAKNRRKGGTAADAQEGESPEIEPGEQTGGRRNRDVHPLIETDDAEQESKYRILAAFPELSGMKGFCPVALRNDRELLRGKKNLFVKQGDEKILFSSREAKKEFESNPEKYLPVADGNDAVLLGESQPVAGSLDFAVWYRDRLYLFSNLESLQIFVENPAAYEQGGSADEAPARRRTQVADEEPEESLEIPDDEPAMEASAQPVNRDEADEGAETEGEAEGKSDSGEAEVTKKGDSENRSPAAALRGPTGGSSDESQEEEIDVPPPPASSDDDEDVPMPGKRRGKSAKLSQAGGKDSIRTSIIQPTSGRQ